MTEGDIKKLTQEEIEIMRAKLSAEEAELEARLKAEREVRAKNNPTEEPVKEKEEPKPNKPETPTRKPIEVNLKPGVHKKSTIREKVGALIDGDLGTIGRFARNTTIDPALTTPIREENPKREPIEINLKPKRKNKGPEKDPTISQKRTEPKWQAPLGSGAEESSDDKKPKKKTKVPKIKIGTETMAHMRAGLGARPEDNAVDREREALTENTEATEVREEITQLPKEERSRLAVGLGAIGFVVEKKKNNFFAGVFGGIAKILPKGKKEGTISKFCKELRDSFVRDADTAQKKAAEVKEGKQKRSLENAGRLFGNLIKYGRTITDLTGISLASPLRYVMMGGMAFTRGAGAAKETRLKNEEVIEGTRIADAERAYKEAWDIYERARKEEGVEEENVSAETLKEAFLMQMPEDIKKRLEDTSVANGFLQKYFRKDLEFGMRRILAKIEKIQKDKKLSAVEKKTAEKKLIKQYEERLKDFDRMLTQYGTVDELAMAGRYAQIAGKTVVAAVTVETLALSVEKLFEKLSDVLGGTENVPTQTNPILTPRDSIRIETDSVQQATTQPDPAIARDSIMPPKDSVTAQIDSTRITTPAPVDSPEISPQTTPQNIPIDPDTMIGKGEGIEHALRRQIENDETIARALGYQGSMENTSALREFSGIKAHEQAIAHGYVSSDGQEIRIGKADEVAYQLKVEDGKIEILERDAEGNLLEKRTPGMVFEGIEGDEDRLEKNEYLHGAKVEKPRIPVVGESLTAEELRARIEGALEGKIEPSVGITTESPEPEIEMKTADKINTGDMKKVLTPDQVLDATQSIEPERPGTYRPYNPPDETLISRNVSPEYGTYKPYNNPLGPVGNEVPLPSQALEQVDSIFANNLAHMFPINTEEVWEMLKEMPAEKTIELKPEQAEEGMESFLSLIHKLRDISGLEPQSETLITSAETNEQYMKRALRFIANRKPERLAEVTMQ